ncbi:thiamine-precursor transporter protein (ThiW) [Oxobacter pfennigii]|uniref:Thiamine-precursor transporter protein (ThiW) n=1 Tax=Oxobacter pfennigii TaxID=36849 RepID=A0A0P8WSG4_9CLOT|nr:energy coupling factor transporter S component ThiW [Oxobacter pfennigii]KPU45539.1 thiamine-precursor transporter protein (ThiW) [Oxobacter pfennigii]
MKSKNIYKLTLSALLVAFGVLSGSVFYIPFLGGKMFPVQHFINVFSGVLLGPLYAVVNAFLISLLRNIIGTGSLLAFPGSIIGAFLAGLLYKKFKSIYWSALGEVIGTGTIGAIAAYPVSVFLMGKEAAIFAFVVPFSLSTVGGAIFAVIILSLPVFKKIMADEQKKLN